MSSKNYSDDEIEEESSHPKKKLKNNNNRSTRDHDNSSDHAEEFVDSSEEDENEPNQYQYDGFVVGADDDEDGSASSRKKRKEKRKKNTNVGSDTEDGREDNNNTNNNNDDDNNNQNGDAEGSDQESGSRGDGGSVNSGSDQESEIEEESEEEDQEAAQQRRIERRRRREERRKRDEQKTGKGLQRLKKLKSKSKDSSDKEDEEGFNEENVEDDDMDSFVRKGKRDHYGGFGGERSNRMMDDIFDEDEDEDDIFEDMYDEDGGLLNKSEAEKQKDRLEAIRQQYEPSLLEEKHFTDADEEIRNKNLPERFISRKGVAYSGENATTEEAEWIYEVAFETRDNQNNVNASSSTDPLEEGENAISRKDQKAISAIVKILKYIQRDSMEIPYIYTYEKDTYEPFFTLQELWNIFDLDEKWAHMKVNKRNLDAISNNNTSLDAYRTVLLESRSEESISDLYDLFQMINGIQKTNSSVLDGGFGDDNTTITLTTTTSTASNSNNGGTSNKQKKAIKRDLYTVYTKAGLGKFLPNFGMTAQEFGSNLMENYTNNKPRDQIEEPAEKATGLICLEADSAQRVLQATRYMMAQEIGYDPHVRYSVRMIYRKYAHITTTPTLKGHKEIDVFHPYFTVKSIQEKPAHLFDDSQYLLILKAEKEGFIKSTMAITEKTHNSVIIPEMETLYLSDGTSAVTQQWNEQRKLIIREALGRFLYPVLEKELRNKLLTEASNRVAFECAKKLEDKIRVSPWKPLPSSSNIGHSNSQVLFGGAKGNNGSNGYGNSSGDEDEEEDIEYDREGNPIPFKILSLCWGAEKIPTMGVILNSDGEVISHLKLDFICDRLGESMKDKKEKDIKKLEDLCAEHQPRLVLVSAVDLDSKRLYEEIKEHIQRWCTNDLSGHRKIKKSCLVNYTASEIGTTLQISSRLQEEFKEYPPVLKHAIAVGRCVLDPITEYSSLCNDHNEILYLKLHPLQDMISKDYLVKLLHRCFINVVNAVGVDINRMIQCRFTSSTLQFVSGLGSRKSQMLLNNIFRRGGYITSRSSLGKLLNQDIVYKNCIGFIQIRERYTAEYKADLLDDTRIHPDNYPITYRIAAEALDKPLDENSFHSYIEDIMKKPKKLDRLDLDAFADIIESHEGRPAKKLLYFIKKELTHPFADIRHPYEEPTPDQIFEWLTGETDVSLRRGTMVTVTTIRTFDNNVKCKLDNGLEGSIPTDCISDGGENSKLGRGLTINARVMGVDKSTFNVTLSCKPSDLSMEYWEEAIFRELKENGANQYLRLEDSPAPAEPVRRKQKRERRVKRTVIHPLWHDFTCLESEAFLFDKPIGEALLRPSSKGHDHITATFKFAENIYLHHDIKEADKPNAVSLGKSFHMDNTKYDSLDEILARHVEYLINNLNEVKTSTHWKEGNRSDLDDLIRAEKAKYPKTIPYYFGYDYEHPGFLTLYHVPNVNPRREPILVKAEGFVLRKQLYPTYYDLLKYFKRNYDKICSNTTSSSSSSSSRSSSSSTSGSSSNQRLPSNAPPRPISGSGGSSSSSSSGNNTGSSRNISNSGSSGSSSSYNNNNNNNNNMQQQPQRPTITHQQYQAATQQPPQRPGQNYQAPPISTFSQQPSQQPMSFSQSTAPPQRPQQFPPPPQQQPLPPYMPYGSSTAPPQRPQWDQWNQQNAQPQQPPQQYRPQQSLPTYQQQPNQSPYQQQPPQQYRPPQPPIPTQNPYGQPNPYQQQQSPYGQIPPPQPYNQNRTGWGNAPIPPNQIPPPPPNQIPPPTGQWNPNPTQQNNSSWE